jgi:preprotein translocase subunit YajC
MSFFISDAIAEAGAETAGAVATSAAQQPDPLASLILPIGLVVLFYFFLIRPQSKRQKEHRKMVNELQKGEEVVTSGGILGKITSVNENFVSLEIAKGMTITIQKHAVQSIMPKGTYKEQQN